jgi:hypothetical protein
MRWFFNLGLIVIAAMLLFNLSSLNKIDSFLTGNNIKEEQQKSIKLTVLGADCEDCFNIQDTIDVIKQSGIIFTEETRLDLKDSLALAEKYSLEKLPDIVIEGDIDGINLDSLKKTGNVLTLKNTAAPYFDVAEQKVKGLIKTTIIQDNACKNCSDMQLIVGQLKDIGIKTAQEENFDYKSKEGKEIIKKYSLNIVPALILSKEFGLYQSEINSYWSLIGTIEDDGSYVLRTIQPPYLNLTTKKVEGMVKLIMMTDRTCTECYDVNDHKGIISNIGLAIAEEKMVDVDSAEGKGLVAKYNITDVPTIILSKDAAAYDVLNIAWPSAGTVEDDGSYVFRNLALMGNYRNIDTGNVIKPLR